MALISENFLKGNLLWDRLEQDPQKILQEIIAFFTVSREPGYYLIASDVCCYLAGKLDPENRIRFYLSAYYFCFLFFKEKERKTQEHLESAIFLAHTVKIFNRASAGIFQFLNENHSIDAGCSGLTSINGQKFVIEPANFSLSVSRSSVTGFSPCSDYEVSGLRQINRYPGIGIPLVARIANEKLSQSLKTPPGMTIPVTMLIQGKELSSGEFSILPVFLDTSMQKFFHVEETRLMHGDWPLAKDFTTPWACFLSNLRPRNLLSAMLFPFAQEKLTGLYMVEPYQPNKIPVVFVHGLLSGPETWGEMINSLKVAPQICRKYQFWFFYYSTGAPVLYSANRLRQTLLNAQKEYCTTPEATENFDKMILVGHSMGGLITRLLLQQDPDWIITHSTGHGKEELLSKLSPKGIKYIDEIFRQEPLPFIRRAIFMAVPFRGAKMARRPIARLGMVLTRQTAKLRIQIRNFKRIIRPLFKKEDLNIPSSLVINGIGNLDPQNAIIQSLSESQIKRDVETHSIIGSLNGECSPDASDGIVPYSSSHLDGVVSEFIVRSNHSVHKRPAVIREVLRILLLHLNQSN